MAEYPRKGDIVCGRHYAGLVIDFPKIYLDGSITLQIYVLRRVDLPEQANLKVSWSFTPTTMPEIIRCNP